MTAPASLADLLGAEVRVGLVRIGQVVGIFVDDAGRRVIGLEVSSAGGMRRFLPWVAARRDRGLVDVESALVLVDDGGSYERLGARSLRDPEALSVLRALPDGEIVPAGGGFRQHPLWVSICGERGVCGRSERVLSAHGPG